jgi:hypothetical protein
MLSESSEKWELLGEKWNRFAAPLSDPSHRCTKLYVNSQLAFNRENFKPFPTQSNSIPISDYSGKYKCTRENNDNSHTRNTNDNDNDSSHLFGGGGAFLLWFWTWIAYTGDCYLLPNTVSNRLLLIFWNEWTQRLYEMDTTSRFQVNFLKVW